MKQLVQSLSLAIAVTACGAGVTPPPPAPAPRPATKAAASFGKTWDAVIGHFAENSIPIRTIDRSSGLIVTDPMFVSKEDGKRYAWCAWASDWLASTEGSDTVGASSVSYNVLVRGDSAQSTIRVNARWTTVLEKAAVATECQSNDVYEPTLEALIRKRAEE